MMVPITKTICTLVAGLALQSCVSKLDIVDDFYFCQQRLSEISESRRVSESKNLRGPETGYTCAEVIKKYGYGG